MIVVLLFLFSFHKISQLISRPESREEACESQIENGRIDFYLGLFVDTNILSRDNPISSSAYRKISHICSVASKHRM